MLQASHISFIKLLQVSHAAVIVFMICSQPSVLEMNETEMGGRLWIVLILVTEDAGP